MRERMLAFLMALILLAGLLPTQGVGEADVVVAEPFEEEIGEIEASLGDDVAAETAGDDADVQLSGTEDLLGNAADVIDNEPASQTDAETAFVPGYVRVVGEGAVLLSPEGPWDGGTLPAGRILYASEADESGRLRAWLDTADGVVNGWIDANSVIALDGAETSAFIEAALAVDGVRCFDEDGMLPLQRVDMGDEQTESETENNADAPAQSGLCLSEERLTLTVGGTAILSVADAPEGSVTWTVADWNVATVDSSGLVSAVGEGSTLVTATAPGGESGACEACVNALPASIQFDVQALNIGLGETTAILCRVMNGDGNIYAGDVVYSTSAGKVVAVEQDGTIKGKKTGSATITAAIENGPSCSCKVRVKKAPGKLTAVPGSVALGVGERIQLGYKLPSGTAGAVSYACDGDLLTIDDAGVATANRTGSGKVTLRTYNNKTATVTVNVMEAPETVRFEDSALTLGVGEKRALKAAVNDGASSGLSFTTADEGVAALSGEKLVGRAVGETTVTVETYNGKSDVCAVTVRPAPSSVSLPMKKLVLGVGGSFRLEPSIGDAASAFTYRSSNKKVVRVDVDGTLRAVKTGKASVTVKTYNGKSCKLSVVVKKAPASIAAKPASRSLGVGERFTLGNVLSPAGAHADVTFEAEDEDQDVLDINRETGEITALREGRANVRIQTYNGLTAVCAVSVFAAPASIDVGTTVIDLNKKDTFQLRPVLSNGSCSALSYESADPSVAKVSSGGLITAKKKGRTTITVKTYLPDVFAQAEVIVWEAPSKVWFDPAEAFVNIGETFQLAPKIPEGTRTEYTYRSGNTERASVSADGTVTALSRGKVKLTATTKNGKKASLALTVCDPDYPEKLVLTGETPVLNVGETWQAAWQVLPETADPALSWSSSNENAATVDQQGLITSLGFGYSTITATSAKNSRLSLKLTIAVQTDDFTLVIPARTTDIPGIAENMEKIYAIRDCAIREIDRLNAGGVISNGDAQKRRGYINNIFTSYAFPWMTPKKQLYWNANNSERGAKDFKPGRVYYGLPYISGVGMYRAHTVAKAVAKGGYVDTGNGYYMLKKTNYSSRYYYGCDCSGLVDTAIWGMGNGARSTYRTVDIAQASEYKTVSDYSQMRPGDLICKSRAHVVMFLYYANPEKTKIMIIENGGSEAGSNTVHCCVMNLSKYMKNGYNVRRVASLD